MFLIVEDQNSSGLIDDELKMNAAIYTNCPPVENLEYDFMIKSIMSQPSKYVRVYSTSDQQQGQKVVYQINKLSLKTSTMTSIPISVVIVDPTRQNEDNIVIIFMKKAGFIYEPLNFSLIET